MGKLEESFKKFDSQVDDAEEEVREVLSMTTSKIDTLPDLITVDSVRKLVVATMDAVVDDKVRELIEARVGVVVEHQVARVVEQQLSTIIDSRLAVQRSLLDDQQGILVDHARQLRGLALGCWSGLVSGGGTTPSVRLWGLESSKVWGYPVCERGPQLHLGT